MLLKKYFTFILILIFFSTLFGQNKSEGKLRIILKNFGHSIIRDSSKLIIYRGDNSVMTLYFQDLLKKGKPGEDLIFVDQKLMEGDYVVIIENLFDKPLLINNLRFINKVINWLPIDYIVLGKYDTGSNKIIVADRNVLLEKYWKDTQ
jgi:hypothetical protein